MVFSRRQLARIIHIACLAMLMAALAPAVSQMLAGRMPIPACHVSADAPAQVPLDAPARAAHPLTHHCGYCVLQADLPYLPTLPAAQPVAETLPPASLPPLRRLPVSLVAWIVAQPRAPPAS